MGQKARVCIFRASARCNSKLRVSVSVGLNAVRRVGNSDGKNLFYSAETVLHKLPFLHGAVAQLIERVVRNDEVVGLIPICSTILRRAERR